jgi:hypothetical protein
MTVIIPEEVTKFLNEFKRHARKKIFVKGDPTWKEDLEHLSLTRAQRDEILFSLAYKDYYRGPSKDINHHVDVWEFGRFHGGKEIYIKLKIIVLNEGVFAICFGFHEAKEPITYPHKKR